MCLIYLGIRTGGIDVLPVVSCHVETVCLLGNRNAKPDTRVKLSVDTEELQRVKNGEKI